MTSQTTSPWKNLIDEKLEKEMHHRTMPLTSYYLMRQHILPDVFGKSLGAILYWSGKTTGNQLDVSSIKEVIDCFDSLQLGTLNIMRETSKEIVLRLEHSPLLQFVSLKVNPPLDLSFECGLIAGMIEKTVDRAVSGQYEIITVKALWPTAEFKLELH